MTDFEDWLDASTNTEPKNCSQINQYTPEEYDIITERRKVKDSTINKWNASIDLPGMLLELGENLDREGLQETPDRINRAWREQLSGYTEEADKILKKCFDAEDATGQLQLCQHISFTSTCEHHFMPFYGYIDIAYVPNKYVIGLSKLTRLTDCFAKRLQIQERLVSQIAKALYKGINAKGVIVIATATHLCCKGRGIKRSDMDFKCSAQCGTINWSQLGILLQNKESK